MPKVSCGCLSSGYNNNQGDTIGGVALHYSTPSYQPGSRSNLRCCSELKPRLDDWTTLWSGNSYTGKPTKIVYIGAATDKYPEGCNDNNSGSSSRHEYGGAFDLTGLEFENRPYWWNNNYGNDKQFTMGVEGHCQRLFRYSLGHHYDGDHRNHIHLDDSYDIAYGRTSWAQNNWLRFALNDIFGYSLPTGKLSNGSDYYTSSVRNAVNSVLSNYGGVSNGDIVGRPIHWKELGRLCWIHGTD